MATEWNGMDLSQFHLIPMSEYQVEGVWQEVYEFDRASAGLGWL